ncbi:unnamed protein product [Dicrocoelium dendriticum]|nr:unnamed protein product [Dicrocoelium dendriticum]
MFGFSAVMDRDVKSCSATKIVTINVSGQSSHEPSFFVLLVSAILGVLNTVVYAGQVRITAAPPPPPPEKFHLGGSYDQWELQTRGREHPLVSILASEVYNITSSVVNAFATVDDSIDYGRCYHPP